MQSADHGISTLPSSHSVQETVSKLEALLRAKGVKLFALVDHSGEAEAVGLTMRPTKLLIFGNPAAGTPIMNAAPTSAIDLPLKILVWEDKDDRVWVSFNDPAYLADRHNIPHELLANIAVVKTLASNAAS
jgi:uncharacterized protein (DUF302 family)